MQSLFDIISTELPVCTKYWFTSTWAKTDRYKLKIWSLG